MESFRRGASSERPNPSPEGPAGVYCFADFTLDPREGILRRLNAEIDLRSKSFEVLIYIVERHGHLVTRDELMRAVWPDIAVTDESVTRCIADIRKALGDEDQRLIRTVPRRGYVFAAQVLSPVRLRVGGAHPAGASGQPLLVDPERPGRGFEVVG